MVPRIAIRMRLGLLTYEDVTQVMVESKQWHHVGSRGHS